MHSVYAGNALERFQAALVLDPLGDERRGHRPEALANLIDALEVPLPALPPGDGHANQRPRPEEHHHHNREDDFGDVLDKEGHSPAFCRLRESEIPVRGVRTRRRKRSGPSQVFRMKSADRRTPSSYTRAPSVKPNPSARYSCRFLLSAKWVGGAARAGGVGKILYRPPHVRIL